MLNRLIRGWGIHPVVGYPLLAMLFTGGSWLLFSKSEYAAWLYLLLALFLPGRLANVRRNEFLKICFHHKYRIIRMLENLIAVIPFTLFLFFKHRFILGASLIGMAVFISLFRIKLEAGVAIPTPFYKYPFEFTTGFRKTFFLIGLSYLICGIGVVTDNFNLGIFALILLFVLISAYYSEVEKEYYVWQSSCNGQQFLWSKTKVGLAYASIFVLPVVVALAVAFFQNLLWILPFLLGGYVFFVCIVFMKYSSFPAPIGILQVVLMTVGLFFPPLLLAIIPYFAFKSVKQLNVLLK